MNRSVMPSGSATVTQTRCLASCAWALKAQSWVALRAGAARAVRQERSPCTPCTRQALRMCLRLRKGRLTEAMLLARMGKGLRQSPLVLTHPCLLTTVQSAMQSPPTMMQHTVLSPPQTKQPPLLLRKQPMLPPREPPLLFRKLPLLLKKLPLLHRRWRMQASRQTSYACSALTSTTSCSACVHVLACTTQGSFISSSSSKDKTSLRWCLPMCPSAHV
mmetsp:Transcript_28835/g.77673  ORF Transcript_28835/g.77673 Transcript_28835/m.77673 type:complete len:218 (+) Transcript_28835:1225-1878(+)